MRRSTAVATHAVIFVVSAALYFFVVLPRWYDFTGDIPHGLATALRILTGVLVGLAALPVVFTLAATRRPERGTPQLALGLRTWSIVGHVLAGALIVGAAISEIWLNLHTAGPYLFGIYGAAAAIAILGAGAFYLAYTAELPPPPPKPLKPKAPKTTEKRRGRRPADESAQATADDAEAPDPTPEPARGLRNRRPAGKSRVSAVVLSDAGRPATPRT